MKIDHATGWLKDVMHKPSPHFAKRPDGLVVDLLVIHNISLPPGKFGGPYIDDFFCGQLDVKADPFFKTIVPLRVSSHVLIRRDGSITQYVSFYDMAWHAGISSFQGQSNCNHFSVGIELEGADDVPYEPCQYTVLAELTKSLIKLFPEITPDRIVGHSDIAPGRKTDPGEAFDWKYYRNRL